MQTICMDGQCSKIAVDGFKWKKSMLQFNEDFIKNYNEDSDKGFILEVVSNIQKIYLICIVIYHFYQKE